MSRWQPKPVTAHGRAMCADLAAWFAAEAHLTPEEIAEYRQRLDAYARSSRQSEMALTAAK